MWWGMEVHDVSFLLKREVRTLVLKCCASLFFVSLFGLFFKTCVALDVLELALKTMLATILRDPPASVSVFCPKCQD